MIVVINKVFIAIFEFPKIFSILFKIIVILGKDSIY